MTRRLGAIFVAAVAAVGLLGCDTSLNTKEGGVILSITEIDNFPQQVSMAVAREVGLVTMDVTISNVPLNPGAGTSALMDVELLSYEITFTRGDTGTRVPNPFVRGMTGVVPVSGTLQIDGLAILTLEQLLNEPLSDLLVENGGIDSETGGQTILLNIRMRFFGRTLSGTAVETGPGQLTIEFTQ